MSDFIMCDGCGETETLTYRCGKWLCWFCIDIEDKPWEPERDAEEYDEAPDER